MPSSLLNRDRAVQMNIVIMRAVVRLREALATSEALARRIDELAAAPVDHFTSTRSSPWRGNGMRKAAKLALSSSGLPFH